MEEAIPTVKEYVIDALVKMTDRDEIIKEVCLRENCFWDEGESLVNRIESENKIQLEKRKSPFMLILSFFFAAAGLVGALYSFYGLAAPIYSIWKERSGLAEGALWIYNFWSLFPLLLLCTGMTITGLFGVIHSVKGLRGEEMEDPL